MRLKQSAASLISMYGAYSPGFLIVFIRSSKSVMNPEYLSEFFSKILQFLLWFVFDLFTLWIIHETELHRSSFQKSMFSVWRSVDQASKSSSMMGFKNYFSQFIFQIVLDFFRFFSSLFFLIFRIIATVSGLTAKGT